MQNLFPPGRTVIRKLRIIHRNPAILFPNQGMVPVALSGRLPVVGSVGRYPADYLIGRDPIPYR